MKKVFALLIFVLMFAVSGCVLVRLDTGMEIKPDGSVDVNTKLVGDPMIRDEIFKLLRKDPTLKIYPVTAGNWVGYNGVASYKTITDMAKTNEMARGQSRPERNIHADGVLYRTGIMYDYCKLNLVFDFSDQNGAPDSAHTYDVPNSPGMYFTLRTPYEVESTNADTVSPDKKLLTWDLAKYEFGGKHRYVKASFKIWHKGAVIGLAVLAVVLLGAGAVFYKKSKASYLIEEQKSKRNVSFALLGAAVVILIFMIARVAVSPTLTSKDRISPMYDGSGKIVSSDSVVKDSPAVPKVNEDKNNAPATEQKTEQKVEQKTGEQNAGQKGAKPAPDNTQSSNANNATVPIVIAGAYHSSADQEGNYVHSAKLAVDGDTKTCWSEGVKGLGIGENIEINFNAACKVSGMNIWIGHQKSEALFYQNARPVAVRVVGSDGSSEVYKLKDAFGSQRVEFKQPITVNKIKLVVQEVARGSKYEDTSIAEVNFF